MYFFSLFYLKFFHYDLINFLLEIQVTNFQPFEYGCGSQIGNMPRASVHGMGHFFTFNLANFPALFSLASTNAWWQIMPLSNIINWSWMIPCNLCWLSTGRTLIVPTFLPPENSSKNKAHQFPIFDGEVRSAFAMKTGTLSPAYPPERPEFV